MSHSTPTMRISSAISTYTSPAAAAPMIMPSIPSCTVAAPANAALMEPMNAKDEPSNTGLFRLVKPTYTSVPTPAPNIAAAGVRPLPIITGTAIVAARIASICWSANTIICPSLGFDSTSYTILIHYSAPFISLSHL